MTECEETLYQLKGVISDLPPEAQAKIKAAIERINAEVKALGESGQIALPFCTMQWLVENGE